MQASLMSDLKLQVAGQDVSAQLGFKDVIFVMEARRSRDMHACMHASRELTVKDVIFVMKDVDAASKVVHRRDEGGGAAGGAPAVTKTTIEVQRPDPSGSSQLITEKVTRVST